jgi:putative ABC transport system substrate-binding protein
VNRRELLFVLGALASRATRSARASRVLVLYPELPEPERRLFRVIVENFSSATSAAGLIPIERALPGTERPAAVERLISDERPAAIVALGSAAISLAEQAHPSIPIIAGAAEIQVPTPGLGGISLIANPHQVFATLTEIAPNIKSIAVVLQIERFGWLRPHMEQAARDQAMQLSVYPAQTIAEAASQYLTILRQSNPKEDSLWLLNQRDFLTPDTLPRLIEEAWARDIVVFSSVLEHVNQGALFAHYLSPATLGRRLSRLTVTAGERPSPITLDDAPARAINLRTARHLTGVVNLRKTTDFDLILGKT